MAYQITSPASERIKRLIRLRDRRHRDTEGVFVVEGTRLVNRALRAGLEPLEVFSDGAAELSVDDVISVDPVVLSRASYRRRSQGVIAIFPQFETNLDRIQPGPRSLFLAAESLEKPGNLGAMLRTADACGANGFIAVDETVDIFNPNVVRASTGAVFGVPIARCGLSELEAWVGGNDVHLVGGTPEAELPFWKADLTGSVALLVGAEDTGLTRAAKEGCSALVSIPMAGTTDSLNTSVSLALLAFEAVRQRRAGDH